MPPNRRVEGIEIIRQDKAQGSRDHRHAPISEDAHHDGCGYPKECCKLFVASKSTSSPSQKKMTATQSTYNRYPPTTENTPIFFLQPGLFHPPPQQPRRAQHQIVPRTTGSTTIRDRNRDKRRRREPLCIFFLIHLSLHRLQRVCDVSKIQGVLLVFC